MVKFCHLSEEINLIYRLFLQRYKAMDNLIIFYKFALYEVKEFLSRYLLILVSFVFSATIVGLFIYNSSDKMVGKIAYISQTGEKVRVIDYNYAILSGKSYYVRRDNMKILLLEDFEITDMPATGKK
jgi:hypothetical protein